MHYWMRMIYIPEQVFYPTYKLLSIYWTYVQPLAPSAVTNVNFTWFYYVFNTQKKVKWKTYEKFIIRVIFTTGLERTSKGHLVYHPVPYQITCSLSVWFVFTELQWKKLHSLLGNGDPFMLFTIFETREFKSKLNHFGVHPLLCPSCCGYSKLIPFMFVAAKRYMRTSLTILTKPTFIPSVFGDRSSKYGT